MCCLIVSVFEHRECNPQAYHGHKFDLHKHNLYTQETFFGLGTKQTQLFRNLFFCLSTKIHSFSTCFSVFLQKNEFLISFISTKKRLQSWSRMRVGTFLTRQSSPCPIYLRPESHAINAKILFG